MVVEQLFQIVSCNLPENMWTNLFNTPTQLMSFLRLFSDSFHIQSNLVTLLQPPKINQKHINTQILLMKENNKNNEELKNKQYQINSNNNIIEGSTKEPVSLPPVEKKVLKASPKSISERLNKPPIKKGPTGTEGSKVESQPKSLSPEPVVNISNLQSNGEIGRKPKMPPDVEVKKSDSPGKSLSPEPPVNNQQNNFTGAQDERNRGVNFRLGKYSSLCTNVLKYFAI